MRRYKCSADSASSGRKGASFPKCTAVSESRSNNSGKAPNRRKISQYPRKVIWASPTSLPAKSRSDGQNAASDDTLLEMRRPSSLRTSRFQVRLLEASRTAVV